MNDTDLLLISRDSETRRTYRVQTKKVRSIRGSTTIKPYSSRPSLSKTMKSTRKYNNSPKELGGSIRGFV
jgi:hypothetical protein